MRQVKYDVLNNPVETIYLDSNGNQVFAKMDAEEESEVDNNPVETELGMVEYQVAFSDARMSLPRNWVYADRNIGSDSEFCIEWEMTPKEFINEYLTDDCYVFAFDTVTGTFLFLNISSTNQKDYSAISEGMLKKLNDEMKEWLISLGDQIVTSKIVKLMRPYCKALAKDKEFTRCYYETVNGGEMFQFMFAIGADEWDPSYEKIYDEIVENSTLNDTKTTK